MTGTEVVVGRIGKAHGIRGELSVEPRTDEPDRRLADGTTLRVLTPQGDPVSGDRPAALTIRSSRWHHGRLLVTFDSVADRDRAETLRGLLLAVEVDPTESPEDPEEFYDHQLVGLRVETTDGARVGELVAVVHGVAQDLLSVRDDAGVEMLVPFVSALVPEVDLDAGRVVVRDVPGLLAPAAEDQEGGA
jgi:16S rRNA processing protein RimM